MILILLAGCSGGSSKTAQAEELALTIREEYAARTAWSAKANLTADYGQRVYTFALTAQGDENETALTLTAPETVAGMTAHLKDSGGVLEYDGVWVETGTLDGGGLTPAEALPELIKTARSGYFRSACWDGDETLLRVDCGDPEGQTGKGREITLWFDRETHALTGGEISWDGARVVSCEILEFT
jgi:hypothetical protein